MLTYLTCCPGDDLNIKGWWKNPKSSFQATPLCIMKPPGPYCLALRRGYGLTEGVYILYLYRDFLLRRFLVKHLFLQERVVVKWSYTFSLCVPLQLWRELETVCSDIKLEIGKKDPFKHAEMCLLIEAWYVPYYEGILQTLLLQIAPFPFAPGMGYTSYYCRWLYGVQGSDRS